MGARLVDVIVEKLHETDRAVFVTASDHASAVWLGRSLIEIAPADTPGLYEVTMPEWLATEKGLV